MLKRRLAESDSKYDSLVSSNTNLVQEITRMQHYIRNLQTLNMSDITGSQFSASNPFAQNIN